MTEARRIRRNALFSSLSSFTRLLANALLFWGLARYYGPDAFGQFTAAHTYLTLFFLVADFGFDILLATEVARHPGEGRRIVEEFLPLKLMFCGIAFVAMNLIAVLSHVSPGTKTLMEILSFGIVGNALANFFFSVMKGLEHLQHETRVSFLQNLVLLIMLVVLGLCHSAVFYVAIAFVLSRFIGLAAIAPVVLTALGVRRLKLSLSGWKPTLRRSVPFGVHLLFGTLYFTLDSILLVYWQGEKAVGIYQAAMKLVGLLLVLPDVLSNALLPVLSRLHASDVERWKRLGDLFVKTLTYVGLPVSLIVYLYAEKIITIVYGDARFTEAIAVLRTLSIVVAIRYIVEPFALMLTTSRRQTARMWIVIGATILNAAMNSYAITRFGTTGAATVCLATSVLAGAAYVVAAARSSFRPASFFSMKGLGVMLFTGCIGAALVACGVASLVLGSAIIVIAYTMLCYFWGYTKEERNLVMGFPWKAPVVEI